jgi:hypothetical protein
MNFSDLTSIDQIRHNIQVCERRMTEIRIGSKVLDLILPYAHGFQQLEARIFRLKNIYTSKLEEITCMLGGGLLTVEEYEAAYLRCQQQFNDDCYYIKRINPNVFLRTYKIILHVKWYEQYLLAFNRWEKFMMDEAEKYKTIFKKSYPLEKEVILKHLRSLRY